MPEIPCVSPDDAKALSKAFVPIILSAQGEAMDHFPLTIYPTGKGGRDFERDLLFGRSIGLHYVCQGFMDRQLLSKTHAVLHCRRCHWYVLIPSKLNYVSDLRRWASKLFKQRKSRWDEENVG